jgi:hypothetical protein
MSAPADTNALNFVRRSLAERRQSRRTTESSTAATAKARCRSSTTADPEPPSPSSAAQFLAETKPVEAPRPHVDADDVNDAQVKAYWAWLAATAENEGRSSGKESELCDVDQPSPAPLRPSLPPAQPTPSPTQQQSRRISYYAGFLPDALAKDELSCAVLPTSDREEESVWGFGGGAATSSVLSDAGNAGVTTTSHPSRGHRRRTTMLVNLAGTVSGASKTSSRSHSVSFDGMLAEAMVSTSNRMKAHQQQQQQQQRHRSSLAGVSGADAQGPSGEVAPGDVGAATAAAAVMMTRRASPPPLLPSPSKASMQASNSQQRCTTANPTTTAGGAVPPWQQRSVPISPLNDGSDSGLCKHDRALTWACGVLPPLHDTGLSSGHNNVVSSPQKPQQHQQKQQLHRSSSSAASSSTYTAPTRAVTARSSRRSTVGERQSLPAPRSDGNASTEAQLSHHQLTEAFYGSYKGGEMARDAYLYFISQQQQQQTRGKDKAKRLSVSVSPAVRQRSSSSSSTALGRTNPAPRDAPPTQRTTPSTQRKSTSPLRTADAAATTALCTATCPHTPHREPLRHPSPSHRRPPMPSTHHTRAHDVTPPRPSAQGVGNATNVVVATTSTAATSAVSGDDPKRRLDALWRRSERIYQQSQQQQQQTHAHK